MANEEHLNILKQGVEVWNRWREENPDVRPNLTQANLSNLNLIQVNFIQTDLIEARLNKSDLSRADLSWSDISKADLRETDFSWANLSGTDLIEANLTGAILNGANLSRSDLRKASLRGADLTEAHFSKADLKGADLTEASIGYSTFGSVNLWEVLGLETIMHLGPSTIGIDAIYQSGGKIPEVFLRGAGVPDIFITYTTSLTSEAIQYYSCFISYSSKDEAFAQRLHADLQQKGVRCWFAPEDMKIGDKIRPRIDESIRIHDKLLLILSEHSINSTWVEKEVETAFEEEAKRKQTVLFPVRLDNTVMETDQAWAADIRRTRHIGDFSLWKDHDAYQEAFERLLRDLKAEG